MIFVTVGTHEQPFDRLIKEVDNLVKNGVITEEVVIQTGFSTYEPQYCVWKKMLSYQEMCQYTEAARIVISHGGPSSFVGVLQLGKVPIVVPRQERFGEHVNDHQVAFCKEIDKRKKNILLVLDIGDLQQKICDYSLLSKDICEFSGSNNAIFCSELEKMVKRLFV